MISVSFVAADAQAAALACFAKSDNDAPVWLGQAAGEAGLLTKAAKTKRFSGAAGKALEITPAASEAGRMIVMGSDADLTPAKAEVLGAKAYQALELSATHEILIDAAALGDAEVSAAAAAGALQYAYRFDTYRTELKDEQKPSLTTIKVTAADPAAAEAAFAEHKAIVEGVYLTRDLVSEPANILYPETFADRAAQLADLGVEITILDKAELTAKGFGALLGVAQGSVKDPRVVIMHWKGAEGEPVAFVGKGVTFDTGGISLKPPAGMEDMKWDMGGAGVVTGLMHTLAARKAKVNAIGIIGLVENMPDGNAQRPGDIVTSLSGKTIQVLNTDAEGRLVLADIMWYVQEVYKPKAMIDLATLTGAILVGLGMEKAGLFSNNDDLAKQLVTASGTSGDPLWHMPIGPEYNKQLDCAEADMKNIGGGRWGGSITAACFLERFVQDKLPWAHLDIAGVTWSDKGKPLSRKGATGWGVRLLNQWVKDTQE